MSDIVDIKSILNANIKKLRKERHLSQEKLAELTDLNTQTISSFERNLVWPTADSLNKIIKALNIKPYELLITDKDSMIPRENVINEVQKLLNNIGDMNDSDKTDFKKHFSHPNHRK